MSTEFEYIKARLNEQQQWHSNKSRWNKNKYYLTEIITLVAGGLIPVVNVLLIIPDNSARIISAALGAIVVVGVGINKLYKFQENWINLRNVSETLKREKELHKFKAGEYETEDGNERNRILLERVENILSRATSQFFAIHSREDGKESTQIGLPLEKGG